MFVTIATAGKQLFAGSVYGVVCPGTEGELTILGHHEPTITVLKKGVISVLKEKTGARENLPIEKGLLEVSGNKVVILL